MTWTGSTRRHGQTRATARSNRSRLELRRFAHPADELPESPRQAATLVFREKSPHFAGISFRLDHKPARMQRHWRVAQFNRRPMAWKYHADRLTEPTSLEHDRIRRNHDDLALSAGVQAEPDRPPHSASSSPAIRRIGQSPWNAKYPAIGKVTSARLAIKRRAVTGVSEQFGDSSIRCSRWRAGVPACVATTMAARPWGSVECNQSSGRSQRVTEADMASLVPRRSCSLREVPGQHRSQQDVVCQVREGHAEW